MWCCPADAETPSVLTPFSPLIYRPKSLLCGGAALPEQGFNPDVLGFTAGLSLSVAPVSAAVLSQQAPAARPVGAHGPGFQGICYLG